MVELSAGDCGAGAGMASYCERERQASEQSTQMQPISVRQERIFMTLEDECQGVDADSLWILKL